MKLRFAFAFCWTGFAIFFLTAAVVAEQRHRLYVSQPGVWYQGSDAPGILIYDIDDGHKLLRRIKAPLLGQAKGIAAHAGSARLFVSNRQHMFCLDLLTEKIVWDKKFDDHCDRMAITPDGKKLYTPCMKSPDWMVVDTSGGEILARIKVAKEPHNTIVGPDGSRVYMAALKSNLLTVADTNTDEIVRRVGPFTREVRPFTINGSQTLCFVNVNGCRGFEVGDLRTGEKLFRVEVPGRKGGLGRHGCPSHGIALTADETEIWVTDSPGQSMQIFDATVMPPKYVTGIKLSQPPDWIAFSIDGRFAYPSSGDVIDTKTRKIVATLKDEDGKQVLSEKLLEIVFDGGKPIRAGDQFGVGQIRTPPKVLSTLCESDGAP